LAFLKDDGWFFVFTLQSSILKYIPDRALPS
jgi:hypothetical protein